MKFVQICLILVLCLAVLIVKAQKNYAVEVGAYENSVSLNHFFKIPEADVYEVKDLNDIYRYWIDCKDKESANQLRQNMISKGFVNARIIDFKAMQEACKATCGYTPPPVTNRGRNNRNTDMGLRNQDYKIPSNEDFEKDNSGKKNTELKDPAFFDLSKDKIACLFYDYKSPQLRRKSKEELDKVAAVLHQNKKFTVKVYAHTDSRGSDNYNLKLSQARARIVHKYLQWRGVENQRISDGPYGERRPIALNELTNGADTPEGRQLNRRVELVVIDGNGKELDLIKPIEVPDSLKIK